MMDKDLTKAAEDFLKRMLNSNTEYTELEGAASVKRKSSDSEDALQLSPCKSRSAMRRHFKDE